MNPRDDHTYVSPYTHWDMHIDIDRMSVPQSWLQVIANGLGLVVFLAAVIGLVMHG